MKRRNFIKAIPAIAVVPSVLQGEQKPDQLTVEMIEQLEKEMIASEIKHTVKTKFVITENAEDALNRLTLLKMNWDGGSGYYECGDLYLDSKKRGYLKIGKLTTCQ